MAVGGHGRLISEVWFSGFLVAAVGGPSWLVAVSGCVFYGAGNARSVMMVLSISVAQGWPGSAEGLFFVRL